MKIYVASSWRNQRQPEVVKALREAGHEVYDLRNPKEGDNGFHWSSIDPNWKSWTVEEYRTALANPQAVLGFSRDFDGMRGAQVGVLVLPCGASAHTEAGWLQASNRPVFVLMEEKVEAELMYRIFRGVCSDIPELLRELEAMEKTITRNKTSMRALLEAVARIRKYHQMDEDGVCECRAGDICNEGVLLKVYDEQRDILEDYLEEHRPRCWDAVKNPDNMDIGPPVLQSKCCDTCKRALRFLGRI